MGFRIYRSQLRSHSYSLNYQLRQFNKITLEVFFFFTERNSKIVAIFIKIIFPRTDI